MVLSKRDSQGNTVLHHACASGRLEVVRLFINFGCNLKAANHQENNLLHMTVLHGSPAVLKELLKRKAVNVEEKNRSDRTPAMLCAEMGSIRMLEMLIRAGAVVSQDLLGIAASKGCLPFVKYCVDTLGLDLAHVDSKRCSVLHHACSQSSMEMMTFLLNSMSNKRDVLLARDHVGRTVIHACCDNVITNPDTLVLLLTAADEAGVLRELVNSKDFFTGSNTCVLVSGRDKGRAAFHYVLSYRHLVSLFEKRVGGGVVDFSQFGTVIKSGWGDYPPEEVVKSVDETLLRKAQLDTAPKIDVTPLHLSVYKEKIEHAEKLIEYGADVNLKDCFGMVPLHLAAMRGNLHMVQKLVKAGAVITVKDNKLQTPMDIALRNEHEKVANYFK
ncbi:hypothetical protein CAPTEDRAFT_160393 [Capitella teleta]|uniref:Uncharacterized protein n=1 Tax=Capitella teleta TaxID=283909 RepID=R7TZK7_CAPTE|nr:hypothetical protein CAPTEDRAFT_160393 [Capitella teleta]|eukprot:ELT99383.1 hypothetical protein CAPTEDRAFT_160393 [Capitella teleta]